MKETLQQQLDRLKAEEEKIKISHLNELFERHQKPESLFEIDFYGNVKPIEIIGFAVGYSVNGRSLYCPYIDPKKKLTGGHVKLYAEYIDSLSLAEKQLFINYKNFGIGSYKLSDITPAKGLAFNESELQEESKRRQELYTPREGYEPCAYCKKQTPINQLIQHRIIGRGRKQVWNNWKKRYENKACVTEANLKFCSSQCAGNEQMSREG